MRCTYLFVYDVLMTDTPYFALGIGVDVIDDVVVLALGGFPAVYCW